MIYGINGNLVQGLWGLRGQQQSTAGVTTASPTPHLVSRARDGLQMMPGPAAWLSQAPMLRSDLGGSPGPGPGKHQLESARTGARGPEPLRPEPEHPPPLTRQWLPALVDTVQNKHRSSQQLRLRALHPAQHQPSSSENSLLAKAQAETTSLKCLREGTHYPKQNTQLLSSLSNLNWRISFRKLAYRPAGKIDENSFIFVRIDLRIEITFCKDSHLNDCKQENQSMPIIWRDKSSVWFWKWKTFIIKFLPGLLLCGPTVMLWYSPHPKRIYNLRHVKVSKEDCAERRLYVVCVRNDLSERDGAQNFVSVQMIHISC